MGTLAVLLIRCVKMTSSIMFLIPGAPLILMWIVVTDHVMTPPTAHAITLCQMEPSVVQMTMLQWLILTPAGSIMNVTLAVLLIRCVKMTSSLMLLIPGAPFHMMWIVVTDLAMTLPTAHHQPPPPPKNQIVLLRNKSLTVKKQGLVILQMNTTAEDIGIAIRE